MRLWMLMGDFNPRNFQIALSIGGLFSKVTGIFDDNFTISLKKCDSRVRIDSAVSNISLYLPLNLFQVFRWQSAKLLLSPCSCAAAPNFAPKSLNLGRKRQIPGTVTLTHSKQLMHVTYAYVYLIANITNLVVQLFSNMDYFYT